MTAPDIFALGGRQENQDAEILALFYQWLDVCRTLDETKNYEDEGGEARQLWNTACDRQCDIEDRVFAHRSSGATGLAVKQFFVIYRETANWVPSFSQVRIEVDQDGGGCWTSMLRDAAALVPEIAECAAAVVHEDAALIAADMDLQWIAACWADKPKGQWSEQAISREQTALDCIAVTVAKTPRGEAIKLNAAP